MKDIEERYNKLPISERVASDFHEAINSVTYKQIGVGAEKKGVYDINLRCDDADVAKSKYELLGTIIKREVTTINETIMKMIDAMIAVSDKKCSIKVKIDPENGEICVYSYDETI